MFKLHVNTWENVKMIMIKDVKSDGFFEIYLPSLGNALNVLFILNILFFSAKTNNDCK